MNTVINMTEDEAFDYMTYLQKTYGDKKARDFFMKMRESQNTQSNKVNGYTGIPWVAKGMTNGSCWWHDKYQVVVEVTDENSAKGGVTYKGVKGNRYYSPDMIDKFKDIHSFSGFGQLIENSKAALEHAHWHCIQQGQPSGRANKGYIASVGDTIRTAYSRNGYKAS